jgi:hypothetical protein
MSKEVTRQSQRAADRLHPAVYAAILGLGLWLILSVWGFFGPGGRTDFALTVVSIFVFIAFALPLVLWRISRWGRAAQPERASLAEWAAGEFDTFSGRLRGWDAIITLILPIAAASLGMTAFAIVLHFVA